MNKLGSVAIIVSVLLEVAPAQFKMSNGTNQRIAAINRGAELVILGHVRSKRCKWSEDGKRIVTEVSISITETLLGNSIGTSASFEMIGGSVGSAQLLVIPTVKYAIGEEVLLFLRRRTRPEGLSTFTVLPGGKLQILRDARYSSPMAIFEGEEMNTESLAQRMIVLDEIRELLRRVSLHERRQQ